MRRAVRNLGYALAADVTSRVLGFIATAFLARALGVDNLGLLGFALAALSYGLLATDLGLLKLGTREVAKARAQAPLYAGGVTALRLMLAFIAFTGMGVLAVTLPKPEPARVLVFSYALCLFPSALLLDWLFQGLEELEHVGIARFLLYLVYLVLVIVLVRRPEHVVWVPFGWFAGNLVSAIYFLAVFRRRIGRLRFNWNLGFWGLIMQAGLPLGIGTVLSQVYMNFGLIALGLLAGNSATGLYTAAFRLVFFVLIVDRVFYSVVFPIIVRRVQHAVGDRPSVEQARAESHWAMQKLAKLLLLVTLPVVFASMALAGPALRLLFGSDYAAAAPVLAVMVWLLFTTTLNSLYAYGLIAAGREREYARNIAIGTGVVVLASIPLVLSDRALGAAIALVAGETVMLAFMLAGFRRVIRVNPAGHLVRPLLVSALLGAVLYRFPPAEVARLLEPLLGSLLSTLNIERLALGIIVILAIAIYPGIMYLVGGFGKEELVLLRRQATGPDRGASGPPSPNCER